MDNKKFAGMAINDYNLETQWDVLKELCIEFDCVLKEDHKISVKRQMCLVWPSLGEESDAARRAAIATAVEQRLNNPKETKPQ